MSTKHKCNLPKRKIPIHNVIIPVSKLNITAYSGGLSDKVIMASTAVGPIVISFEEPINMYMKDPMNDEYKPYLTKKSTN